MNFTQNSWNYCEHRCFSICTIPAELRMKCAKLPSVAIHCIPESHSNIILCGVKKKSPKQGCLFFDRKCMGMRLRIYIVEFIYSCRVYFHSSVSSNVVKGKISMNSSSLIHSEWHPSPCLRVYTNEMSFCFDALPSLIKAFTFTNLKYHIRFRNACGNIQTS